MSATSGRQDGGPMAQASSGLSATAVTPDLQAAIQSLSADGSAWVTITLAQNKTPELVGSSATAGSSPTKESLLDAVADDKITFGCFRASSGKLYGFVCVGDSAPGMAKAKQMMHKNAVMNLFEGKHGEIHVEGVSEFKQEVDKVWP
ncbi:unnamed protein product [Amoebophrya sp. A120]|nr:unnamed protein product [Amoebophrya sp. A120]|eukprot:GSA120T00009455001.1